MVRFAQFEKRAKYKQYYLRCRLELSAAVFLITAFFDNFCFLLDIGFKGCIFIRPFLLLGVA